jgi:hypothetical protein
MATVTLSTLLASGYCSQGYQGGGVERTEFLEIEVVAVTAPSAVGWAYGDVQLVLLEDGEERRLPGRQRRVLVREGSGEEASLVVRDVFFFEPSTLVSTYLDAGATYLDYELRVRTLKAKRTNGEEVLASGYAEVVNGVWRAAPIAFEVPEGQVEEAPKLVAALPTDVVGGKLRLGSDPVGVTWTPDGESEALAVEGAKPLVLGTALLAYPLVDESTEDDDQPGTSPATPPATPAISDLATGTVLGTASASCPQPDPDRPFPLADCWKDALSTLELRAVGAVWRLSETYTLEAVYLAASPGALSVLE